MRILGRHILAEMADCDFEMLNDQPKLESLMKEAARLSGATIVKSVFHRYNPQGLSGIIVIAESHISIHTWPEYGYAAVDCFTCGQNIDPNLTIEHIVKGLNCKSVQMSDVNRGIPSDKNEFIAHKFNTESVLQAGK